MTGIEYLNSEDCPNIKAGMGLTQIQLYVIAGILEAYAEKQLLLHIVSQQRELLLAFCEWKEYNGKWQNHNDQVKDFLKEYKANNCG